MCSVRYTMDKQVSGYIINQWLEQRARNVLLVSKELVQNNSTQEKRTNYQSQRKGELLMNTNSFCVTSDTNVIMVSATILGVVYVVKTIRF